jgi:hypothetical protein
VASNNTLGMLPRAVFQAPWRAPCFFFFHSFSLRGNSHPTIL